MYKFVHGVLWMQLQAYTVTIGTQIVLTKTAGSHTQAHLVKKPNQSFLHHLMAHHMAQEGTQWLSVIKSRPH